MRHFIIFMALTGCFQLSAQTYFWSGEAGNYLANDPQNWRTESSAGSSENPDASFTGDFVFEGISETTVGLLTVYQRNGMPATGVILSGDWNVNGTVDIIAGAQISNYGRDIQCTALLLNGRLDWYTRSTPFPMSSVQEFAGILTFLGSNNLGFTAIQNFIFPDATVQINVDRDVPLSMGGSIQLKSIRSLNAGATISLAEATELKLSEFFAFSDARIEGEGSVEMVDAKTIQGLGVELEVDGISLKWDDTLRVEDLDLRFQHEMSFSNSLSEPAIAILGNGVLHFEDGFSWECDSLSIGNEILANRGLEISEGKICLLSRGYLFGFKIYGELVIHHSQEEFFETEEIILYTGKFAVEGGDVNERGLLKIKDNGLLLEKTNGKKVFENSFNYGVYFEEGCLVENEFGDVPSVSVIREIAGLPWTRYSYWTSPFLEGNLSGLSCVNKYEYRDLSEGQNGWMYPSQNGVKGKGLALQGVSGGTVGFRGQVFVGDLTANTPIIGENPSSSPGSDSWSFIGNPFLHGLNAGELLRDNQDYLQGAIYLWDQSSFANQWGFSSDEYTIINGLGTTNPDASGHLNEGEEMDVDQFWLSPFQAVFVQGAEGNGNGPIAYKVHKETDTNYSFHQKSNDVSEKEKVWLVLKDLDRKKESKVLLGYTPTSTNSLDFLFDAADEVGGFGIYMAEHGKKLRIQGRAMLEGKDSTHIVLNVPSGNFCFGIDRLHDFEYPLLLEKDDGERIDLREQDYCFSASSSQSITAILKIGDWKKRRRRLLFPNGEKSDGIQGVFDVLGRRIH